MNNPPRVVRRIGFRGYSTHREFAGYRIPVPVQNIVMRDYARTRDLQFKLGVDEYNFPKCYLRLMSLLRELPTLEGIIMCSLFMLPADTEKRSYIYEEFLRQGASLHLIMENIVVESQRDVKLAEELLQVWETSKACPVAIPSALLPELNGREFFASDPQ